MIDFLFLADDIAASSVDMPSCSYELVFPMSPTNTGLFFFLFEPVIIVVFFILTLFISPNQILLLLKTMNYRRPYY